MPQALEFSQLKRNLKKDAGAYTPIKIALLGDTATQLLAQAIKGYGHEVACDFQIFEADYDQIERQVFDPASELYRAEPRFILIFQSSQKLLKKFYGLGAEEKRDFAARQIEHSASLYKAIKARLPSCSVLQFNFLELNDRLFGNYSNQVEASFPYQLRKLNYELMNLSRELKGFFINDLASLQDEYGTRFIVDQKIYVNTDIVFSIDFLPIVAKNVADQIQALCGKVKKCLIVDLDNTLWGGAIGDEGLENIQLGSLGVGKAFTELQLWIKQLRQRGILIAVCSKNDEKTAREPFEKHPDMVLALEDISVFVANWDDKAKNIRQIQKTLNIGLDSMVFVDDNPVERNAVRSALPEVAVPELPMDAAEYLRTLQELNLFETASFTEEDELRTRQYQEESKRSSAREVYADGDAFLKSLEMVSEVRPFEAFQLPRIAQLIQRSNQFNLRTVRHTEDDIQRISQSDRFLHRTFTLADKYGDYGLIGLLILEKRADGLFIDSWIMSCRVLNRGMEGFMLNSVAAMARAAGFKKLLGEYVATPKNAIVKDHYPRLGFAPNEGLWDLPVEGYESKQGFIALEPAKS